MELPVNAISWFEIPVTDFDRAKKFYSAIYTYEMPEMEFGAGKMGILPHDQTKGLGGAIVQMEGVEPSDKGSVVYLNGGEDLNIVLNRVEAAGGSVVMPKTIIGEGMGHYALFSDTEGNRVGLYSMN